jgi:glucose/arabinose dehydrogenase
MAHAAGVFEMRPRISKRPTREGMEDPLVAWLPSIGLTGMTFYTGDRFPHWKRNVFVAGLREGGIPRTARFNASYSTSVGRNFAANDGALLRLEPRD